MLRGWDDPADPHPEGSVDPARDLELIETEFLLADLDVAQRRLERLEALVKKAGRPEDRKERDLLARVVAWLEEERPLREADFHGEEEKILRGYAFLTAKPLLVALNLPEDRTADLGKDAAAFGLGDIAARPGHDFVALSARIEQEIASLSPEDAALFRADLGIDEPALDPLGQVRAFVDQGELGRGGMGSVRRMWDPRILRTTAMKAISSGCSGARSFDSPGSATRFQRDAAPEGSRRSLWSPLRIA